MATQDDVRRICLGLPGVSEDPGAFGFSVRGRRLVWLWPERVHPRRKKVPNPDVVVVPVADLEEKRALLASDPRMFFTTDHYDGYKAVLVRLEAIGVEELGEVVTDSWRAQAPKRLLSGASRRLTGSAGGRPVRRMVGHSAPSTR